MSLPGLFVEYLVNGSVALIWLMPLLFTFMPDISRSGNLYLVFVPGLYVLGMMIDSLSWAITRPYKKRLHQKICEEYKVTEAQMDGFSEKLLLHNPELLTRLDMFSSRDRIARGALSNAMLATAVLCGYFLFAHAWVFAIISLLVGTLISFLCLLMWKRYQSSSYEHEIYCLQALEDKKQKK